MASANVSVSFEAESAEEAQKLIEKWKLHEGCNVFVSVTEGAPPMQADAKGKPTVVPEPEIPGATTE